MPDPRVTIHEVAALLSRLPAARDGDESTRRAWLADKRELVARIEDALADPDE